MSGSLVLFKIPKNKINQDPEILSLTTQEARRQEAEEEARHSCRRRSALNRHTEGI